MNGVTLLDFDRNIGATASARRYWHQDNFILASFTSTPDIGMPVERYQIVSAALFAAGIDRPAFSCNATAGNIRSSLSIAEIYS